MENKIKVGVVKIRTVSLQKSFATVDNDIYPYFADETVRYKVYLSDDISTDIALARETLQEIIDKVEKQTLKLTADGPWVDLDDSRQFSKEASQQAVELLAAALPHYKFEAAEYANGLKYEINTAEEPAPERDVVADRLTAMKYLLGAVVVTAIIPYIAVPWISFTVAFIYSMFTACIVYCLLTWIVARTVGADKISVSIGITPHLCLYRLKTVNIFCGPVPVPDLAMPESVMSKYNKSWTIASIPPIIMTLIGYALAHYRDHLYAASPDAVANVLLGPAYSIVALLAVSCILTAAVGLVLQLGKARAIYPQHAATYTTMELTIVIGGAIGLYDNFAEILTFIGI